MTMQSRGIEEDVPLDDLRALGYLELTRQLAANIRQLRRIMENRCERGCNGAF